MDDVDTGPGGPYLNDLHLMFIAVSPKIRENCGVVFTSRIQTSSPQLGLDVLPSANWLGGICAKVASPSPAWQRGQRLG